MTSLFDIPSAFARRTEVVTGLKVTRDGGIREEKQRGYNTEGGFVSVGRSTLGRKVTTKGATPLSNVSGITTLSSNEGHSI